MSDKDTGGAAMCDRCEFYKGYGVLGARCQFWQDSSVRTCSAPEPRVEGTADAGGGEFVASRGTMGLDRAGGHAFPTTQIKMARHGELDLSQEGAVTWLDYAAIQVVAGLESGNGLRLNDDSVLPDVEDIAFAAYAVAEAMLAEKRRREK